MKKYTFLAIATLALLACKNPPAGGNKAVIPLDSHDTEHYSNIVREGGSTHGASSHTDGDNQMANHDEVVKLKINNTEINAHAGGLEEGMVNFLASDGYSKASDDNALKDKWYNFDQVNFKIGSASELEKGSKVQLQNLAKILKAFPDAKIKIGGHTDKTGNETENVKLSTQRAQFIQTQLKNMGVGEQVIGAEGYGSKFSKVSVDASNEERALDRKMAVRFSK